MSKKQGPNIPLSKKDNAALDRAWDKIGKKTPPTTKKQPPSSKKK